MADSRMKNGILNIYASVMNRCVMVLLPFITRTMIVTTLGSSYLGLSGLFTSILNVLNLSELGFGSALVFSMYKPVADNDIPKISALLNVYKKIYRAVGIAILLGGVALMPCLPKLINGTWPDTVNIYVLYFIYLLNTSISYLAFAHRRALLMAYQNNRVLSNVNTILSILLYMLQIALLYLWGNYYLYVCVLPIFTVIENVYVAIYTSKVYPEIKESGGLSNVEKESIKIHVKGIALQKLCSASRNSFDSIVISMYLGLTAITIYNNYFYILSAIHALLYQIPNAIRPSIGNSIIGESVDKNYADFNIMTMIYVWISSVCSACLLCLYQPFMELWMGPDLLLPFGTMCMFPLYFFLLSIGDIITLYKDGAGLWWYGRYRTVIEAIGNLILNFLLGWLWGINGILVATLLTVTFIGLGYGGYIVFKYYFKTKNYLGYIFLELKYLLFTVISAFTAYGLSSLIVPSGFFGLILRGGVCVAVSTSMFWLMIRKQPYYLEAKAFVGRIFGSKNLFKK